MIVIAVVQARMSSSRLPKKVMRKINGRTLLELLLDRLSKSSEISKIVVATTDSSTDDVLVQHVKTLGYDFFRGSENDVLKRHIEAAELFNADIVVRVTSDCPLIDPVIVDEMIKKFKKSKLDYYTNNNPPTFPDGLDTEIITFEALSWSAKQNLTSYQKEHVTPFLQTSTNIKSGNFCYNKDLSNMRWTVDEKTDLQVVTSIFNAFHPVINFSWTKIVELADKNPEIFEANALIRRNEGHSLDKGQKLWKRAKAIIPGGNMLLSKRPERFLPGGWPTYFSKAKGCRVWDLDGNEFIDMSIMGIGTNILGYGHEDVDASVRSVVEKGNMSSLNCPEEVYLVQKLIDMHPWSGAGRLARSGGEANSIAIRIARASSNKDNIAFCGYHGWHDWYLSSNLNDKINLEEHLLPGLLPNGVPKGLKGTSFPFEYNNLQSLQELVANCDIGTIKMEVSRSIPPKDDFLEKVRKLATENGIVLIFDECTSGFRETFGGLHKKFNVEPDLAMFGKALGNGYAITAVIGREDIMDAAQDTFISSTFWTERIGPTAALKTLEVMEATKSWDYITETGLAIRQKISDIAQEYQIDIVQSGLAALTSYQFLGPNAQAFKTFVTQEMLNNGFLASDSVYVCTEHTNEIIERYFYHLEKIFAQIKQCDEKGNIYEFLNYPLAEKGFKRLV